MLNKVIFLLLLLLLLPKQTSTFIMQETKTVIYSVHNKIEFGSGAMSASGTHSCVCFLAGTLVRSAYKKKKKKNANCGDILLRSRCLNCWQGHNCKWSQCTEDHEGDVWLLFTSPFYCSIIKMNCLYCCCFSLSVLFFMILLIYYWLLFQPALGL